MVELVPYLPEHLLNVAVQPAQAWMRGGIDMDLAVTLGRSYRAASVVDGDRVLGCGGIELHWPGRGLVWSFVAGDIGARDFIRCHNLTRRFLTDANVKRLEAGVEVDFEAGHRWMKALGFYVETPCARAWQAGGRDCTIYVKVAE